MSWTDAYDEVIKNDASRRMRAKSGRIDDDRPLVAFLYLLARGHLPVGVIEEVLGQVPEEKNSQFTNGWLAQWAQDAAERLTL